MSIQRNTVPEHLHKTQKSVNFFAEREKEPRFAGKENQKQEQPIFEE